MDITEAQKFWLESDFVFELLKQVPAYIFWKNKSSVYLGCNNAFAYSLGLSSPEEIIGKTDYDLPTTKAESDAFRADDKQVIASKKPKLSIEEYQTRPDGSKVALLTNKVPLLDKENNVVGILGIYYDITERKKKEEELKEAKEKAEAASRAKSMFLANMSHDIKTPIAGIISTAEYLAHLANDPDFRNRADDIVQSGLRLMELMIEIIEVSRLEVRQTTRTQTRFNLKNLIDDIVQLIKPAINEKAFDLNVEYESKIPAFLTGDRWHLYRVILNLLSNAIKFTKEGSITISVETIKQTKKTITLKICIIDTGIGIPKDKQAVIFDNFTRLTPSYEGIYKGTGLGLYIVKQFVKAMDGEIYVESEEGKGSKFICIVAFKIPLDQTASETERKSIEKIRSIKDSESASVIAANIFGDKSNFKNIKILLVEDNMISSRSAKGTLEKLGCTVDTAFSGTEALQLFKPGKYDLIFMDLGLPDMEGVEVTKKIRQQENNSQKATKIIALSAHVDDEIRRSCLSGGMDSAITKPLLIEHVVAILRTFLDNSSEVTVLDAIGKDDNSIPADQLQVIDLELGASIVHANVEQAREALKILHEILPDSTAKIKEAYLAKNMEDLAKYAHKLQGGLSYCGVPRLKLAVKDLDQAARFRKTDELDKLYTKVCNEVKLFNDAYKKL